MMDDDIKIYTPSEFLGKSTVSETEEVKIYTCSSEVSDPEHPEHVP